MLHGLLVELIGLLESETEDEEDEGENDADSERSAPDGAEAAVVSSSGNDVYRFEARCQFGDSQMDEQQKEGTRLTRDKCANDETPVNHGVGEENKPAVAGALLELAARLGAANTASRIFAYKSND